MLEVPIGLFAAAVHGAKSGDSTSRTTPRASTAAAGPGVSSPKPGEIFIRVRLITIVGPSCLRLKARACRAPADVIQLAQIFAKALRPWVPRDVETRRQKIHRLDICLSTRDAM